MSALAPEEAAAASLRQVPDMASAVLPSGSQCAAAAAAVAAAPPGLRLRLLLLLLSAAAWIPTGRCGARPLGPLHLLRHPSSRRRGVVVVVETFP